MHSTRSATPQIKQQMKIGFPLQISLKSTNIFFPKLLIVSFPAVNSEQFSVCRRNVAAAKFTILLSIKKMDEQQKLMLILQNVAIFGVWPALARQDICGNLWVTIKKMLTSLRLCNGSRLTTQTRQEF